MKNPRKTESVLMERVLASIGELPTSPTVVSSVMGLTSNINTGVDKLSQALSADAALTAKVLRLSNSPFYGRARTVRSLNEAIMILGFSTIRSLVVATSTYSMFQHGQNKSLEETLWHHSLATAMAARIIAHRIGKKRLVEEFFLAGLLHDIGILVLLKKMPQEYLRILQQELTTGTDQLELELASFGFTHAELGSLLLERWNFPPTLSAGVKWHCNPELAANCPDSADGGKTELLIAHAISFADEIARSLGFGFDRKGAVELGRPSSAAFLGLSGDTIVEIIQELNDRLAEEHKLFEE